MALQALVLAMMLQGAWIVEEATDPMTDEATVRIAQRSAEGNGELVLRCNGDDFRMLVHVDDQVPSIHEMVNFGKAAAIKGRWRIDDGKADKITFWAHRDALWALEPHSNFSKDAKKFLRKLEGKDQVIFQVEGVADVLTFDLTGLDTSVLASCYEP